MSFSTSQLPDFLLQSLQRMGVTTPTNVQKEAIPSITDGRDGLITAHTGSGKTLAYLIPTITKIVEDSQKSVLVLAPTRELATQIGNVARDCVNGSKIKVAVLVGGQAMHVQLRQLSKKPRMIIGTPGRVFDHIKRKSFDPSQTGCFVLDEVDRMLDLGFSVQIADIEDTLPKERQTLMFSATLPSQTMKIANRYLKDFVRISDGSLNAPPPEIDHSSEKIMPSEKFSSLMSQLESREGSVVVFVNKKFEAKKIALRLQTKGHNADSIHGDLRQSVRDRVIRNFRRQKTRIMVGTDVVARGLDVDHVRHVINYDLPMCPEDYLHRIGRTGRAGETGSAFSMIAPQENSKWRAIQRLIDPEKAKQEEKEFSPGAGRRRFSKRPNQGSWGRRGKNSFSSRSSKGGGFSRGRSSDGEFSERRSFSKRPSRDGDSFGGRSRSSGEGRSSFEERSFGGRGSGGGSFGGRSRSSGEGRSFEERSFGGRRGSRDDSFGRGFSRDGGSEDRRFGNSGKKGRSGGPSSFKKGKKKSNAGKFQPRISEKSF